MKTVYQVLKEMEENGSTLFKLECLEREKENKELKEFFRLCLDKDINYYIKKIPDYNKNHTNEISLSQAMGLLKALSDRVYTGNDGINYLSMLLTKCNPENADVISRIIARDPMCGVGFSLTNKVWPDIATVWPCNLSERSTEKNLKNIKFPAFSEEKSDGMRLNIICLNDQILYYSRNGKSVEVHGMLDDEVRKFYEHIKIDFVLDGEALIIDETDVLDRSTGNGIMNKAIHGTISKEEASKVIFNVWDLVPYETFINKERGQVDYIDTFKLIKTIIEKEKFQKIHLIDTEIVNSMDEAMEFYNRMINKEKEGSILKNFTLRWEDKRSKDSVKLKIEKEVEVLIIGTFPHKKKSEWIGGLTYISSDGMVTGNVGSGLKDEDRKRPPEYYIQQIATLKANGIVKSKQKETFSLFLPRFMKLRLDKNEADSYQQMKDIFTSFIKRS